MKKWHGLSFGKVFWVIAGLTFLFLIDDVLLLLLVFELRLFELPAGLFTVAGIVILALNISLAWLVWKIMRTRPATGPEGMIGKQGVALSSFKKEGIVKVQGEIWQAMSDEPVTKNDRVVVVGMNGLCLKVQSYEARGSVSN